MPWPPARTVTVTASINTAANSLAEGIHNDTITFTNVTNGSGNTTRTVTLTVSPGPYLSVSPANWEVTFAAGTRTFAVSNGGGGALNWTAAVVGGADWLTIASGSSGSGSGTITAAYAANPTASTRVGTIRVTALGATHSPQDVTITQGPSSLLLGLTAERLVERAWIIQREYASLAVTVVNSSPGLVNKYTISRAAAGGAMVAVGEVTASTVGSSWTYNDTFLQKGTNYTYRILALDAQGNVIGASNDVTI